MLTAGQEHSPFIEIDVGSEIQAVELTANGKYIVGGGGDGLGVWRVEDGKQMARMETRIVRSIAVSKDGRWIAAGTFSGEAIMWDAKTYKKVFTVEDEDVVGGVDFSPDSTRLLMGSKNRRATVWGVATHKKVLTLDHDGWMRAVKYSPGGDRITTATFDSVRVWDSNDARLLVEIAVKVTPLFNTGLLWSNNNLVAISANNIKEFVASTGSAVSEWPVHHSNNSSCIALPKLGEFIAYSAYDTVTFWNTSTHTRVGLIQHTQPICSIALSPHHRFLAIGGRSGKIAIKGLRDVLPASYSTVCIVYCRLRMALVPFHLTSISIRHAN